mgnify:FL=1
MTPNIGGARERIAPSNPESPVLAVDERSKVPLNNAVFLDGIQPYIDNIML